MLLSILKSLNITINDSAHKLLQATRRAFGLQRDTPRRVPLRSLTVLRRALRGTRRELH